MPAIATCVFVLLHAVHEARLVDERPRHRDEFEALTQHFLYLVPRHQTSVIDQRELQRCAELPCVFQEIGFLEGDGGYHKAPYHAHTQRKVAEGHIVRHRLDRHRPAHHVHRCLAHEAAAQRERMDAAFVLQRACHLEAFVRLHTALEAIAHIHLHQDRHVLSCRLHHLGHTHLHEAHTVFEASAKLILAVVCIGRKELTDKVSVPGMDFDGIHPRLACQADGLAIRPGHRSQLGFVHPSHARRRINIETTRGRDRRAPANMAMRHIPAMPQLDASGRALGMYRIGYFTQSRDDFCAHPELFFERKSTFRYRSIG